MVVLHHAPTQSLHLPASGAVTSAPVSAAVGAAADNPADGHPPALLMLEAGPACNIGPAELRRRRRAAVVSVGALLLAVGALIAGLLPHWTAPLLAPLAGAATVAVLQVTMRFCVAFGLAGVVGMAVTPGTRRAEPALVGPHRRRALAMLAVSAAVTVVWAVIAFMVVIAVG